MTELEYLLDDLDAVVGSGTQLVSLYVPANKDVLSVTNRIRSEYAEADNIKSKQTRSGVKRALAMVQNELEQVPNDTDHGFVIFAGVDVDGDEHVHTISDVPVVSFRYHCDSTFLTEPLRQVWVDHDTYALVIVERREGTIGKLVGDRIEHVRDLSSDAKGKHSAGGFSNRRFDRLIEESTSAFYGEMRAALLDEFEHDSIDGLVVGGSNLTKDDFVDELPRRYVDKLVGTYAVEYAGESGLSELVRRADRELVDSREQTARRISEEFFTALRTDDPVTYGLEETKRAVEMGAIDTLLVDPDKLHRGDEVYSEIADRTEEMGGDVVEVSDETAEGSRFCGTFYGIGALLRYNIE